jgi:nucleotide-binding universal stress UspA family protein
MRIKNILCPIDYSSSSEAALLYACSLAKDADAEVHIVYVHEEDIAYVEGFGAYLPPADLEGERKRLHELRPPLPVRHRHELIVGSPASAIVEYARDKDKEIDLIVMGTHGRTGLARLLMGSVAEAVVRTAPCPVLSVKQPAGMLQGAEPRVGDPHFASSKGSAV